MPSRRGGAGGRDASPWGSTGSLAMTSAGARRALPAGLPGPVGARDAGGADPDLAALQAQWSWNFAGAPRTEEQEESLLFGRKPSRRVTGPGPAARGALSCARCGLPLGMSELLSHQEVCAGSRPPSPDAFSAGSSWRPRWRGPLDAEPAQQSKRPVASFLGLDWEDLEAELDAEIRRQLNADMRRGGFGARASGGGGGSRATGASGAYFGQYGAGSGGWSQDSRSSASTSASSAAGARRGQQQAPPPPPPPPRAPPAAPRAPAQPSAAALDAALSAHEAAWAKFDAAATSTSAIGLSDVPWPDAAAGAANVLVQHALQRGQEANDVKGVLRRLQLRWHPDKWAQRYVARLRPGEAETILARVKGISQLVNSLKAT
eukprot:TRINITY_DN22933_c0_g1_i1.p1 TRINITY_DN22933_c0_g1~~TRINITY_DN22933_c0_g1_i1.p1  ORF type:complete len:376 (-),score=84.36 TRINITY_DN22933_c0_g1_i1:26-1153(-)